MSLRKTRQMEGHPMGDTASVERAQHLAPLSDGLLGSGHSSRSVHDSNELSFHSEPISCSMSGQLVVA